MSDWALSKVSDLATTVTKGTTPTTGGGSFSRQGVAFVKVESIKPDGTLNPSKLAYIDEDTHRRLKRSILEEDDVLFTIAGTIGRVARVPSTILPANTNQAVAIVRPDRSKVDPRFLMYALKDERRLRHALGRVVQSVQANLSLAELGALELPTPSLPEQFAVAQVLGALDHKIAANADVIRLAENLGRAHFEARAAEGVEVSLSSVARFVNGKAYTKNATGTGRVVVRIAELNSGIGASTVRNDIDVPDDNIARPGDLLFAWSGSLTVARWYRPEAIVNQHIFKVIPIDGIPKWLIHQAVRAKLDEFRAIAADKATTMGHIQRHHLDELVRIPASVDVEKLDDLMTGLWDSALAAEIENLKLTATRDELLPLLMSGKIRVKDTEKSADGALQW